MNVDDMKQADLLRETDPRWEQFLATLVHELRNPLAPIRTGLELIRLMPGDPDGVEEVRNMMEGQVDRLVALINSLSDVSRIARGKFELQLRRVGLGEIVARALEAVHPLIEESGHVLQIDLPEEAVGLQGDLDRLAQALSHLLNNAIRYSPNGSVVRLAAGREGDAAVIRVTDQGPGIPEDKVDEIFDLFMRLNGATAAAKPGLGIGLALVRSLAELHGGSVHANSLGPGQGSEFVVRLPLEDSATPDKPTREPEPAAHNVKPARREPSTDRTCSR
jgi:signal transduction histidine kinase